MNDYDSIQQKRNMIVGGFVIIGIIIFIVMIFQFGELPVSVTKFTSYEIKVRFPSAPGVQENTPVQYCGYHIGRVTHVAPPMLFQNEHGQFAHQITVTMAISNKYSSIPSNVKIKLIKRGLGSSYIEICSTPMTPGDFNDLDPKFLLAGMILQGSTGSDLEFLPTELQDKIETLFDKVIILLDHVNTVVGDNENQKNFKNTLANLSVATSESIETLKQIRQFSEKGTETIGGVSDSVISTSEELSGTLIELRKVLYKINSGEGTAGKLINDGRLYDNLLDSSEELRLAVEKLKKTLDKTSKEGVKVKVF